MSYATPGDYVASCSKSLSSCPACSGIVAVFSASSCMVSVFSALAHRLWSTYQGDASCFKTCSMYTHKDVLARLCFSSMGWECEFGLDRLLLILDSQKFLNNSIEPAHRLWSTYQGDASCFKTCSMYTHKDVLARLCFSSMGWECEFGLDRLLLILDSQKFLNNSIEPTAACAWAWTAARCTCSLTVSFSATSGTTSWRRSQVIHISRKSL